MKNSRKTLIKITLWIASIVLVLVIGIIFFPRENPSLNFWGSLYFTIRLFILEHDLANFPSSPFLVFIYFFAPAIALSAVGTAVSYFLRQSPLLTTRWKSDHIVICGLGRTGKLLAGALKKAGIMVVGVDSGNPDDFEEWRTLFKIPVIFGDFHYRAVLEKAGAERARTIVFACGDDIENLEGAVGAYDWLRARLGSVRLLWTHISNEKLADTARQVIQTEGVVGIRFFDTYYIAAQNMIAKYFNREIRKDVRHITILGFGKFGRDLVEVLLRDFHSKESRTIEIIDKLDRSEDVKALAKDLGIPDLISFKQASIHNLCLKDSDDKAFFLCTDDDIGNLTAAMMLARDIRASYIYVRMTKWPMSAITEHLEENRGITFFNINDLIMEGICEMPGIFTQAKESDLKRVRRGKPEDQE